MPPDESAVDAYIHFFETLQPDTVGRLDDLATPDVHFQDPFNDVHDRDRFKRALARMFEDVEAPRFRVTDRAVGGDGVYLRWTFTFRAKGKRATWAIEGMSALRFNPDGRVSQHIDHWDAAGQFYEHLPGIGLLLRVIKRRLAV